MLSTLENCQSFEIYRNADTHQLELKRKPRKRLHDYVDFDDATFGQCHVRIQTWFPFDVRIVMNGREWLARQMDHAGIGYLRKDNCFTWIEDFADRQRGDLQSRVLVRGDLSVASQFTDHTVDRFDGVGRRDRSADRHGADGTTEKSNSVMMSVHFVRHVFEIVGDFSSRWFLSAA